MQKDEVQIRKERVCSFDSLTVSTAVKEENQNLNKEQITFYQGSLFYEWEGKEKLSDKESAWLLLN